MRPSHCPKCQGTMTQGWTLDHTQGGRKVGSWVEGVPERSVWVGVKLGAKKPIDIQTWRCNRCGFLESYAPAP